MKKLLNILHDWQQIQSLIIIIIIIGLEEKGIEDSDHGGPTAIRDTQNQDLLNCPD